MKILFTTLFFVSSLLATEPIFAALIRPDKGPGVVYGSDDRREVKEISDPQVRALANSVVGLALAKVLVDNGNGTSTVNFDTIEKQRKVCPDERFKDQKGAMYCTGFLVSPNRIVTAGHCISSVKTCKKSKFVFGYFLKEGSEQYTEISNRDIYSCKELIHSEHNPKEKDSVDDDFAVIELDRNVEGRLPLKLETQSKISVGDKLFAIGHPLGLPMKFADNAWVGSFGPNNYVSTNIDTYTGNSGSPIFNASTLRVEGILIDGTEDFDKTKEGCKKTHVCQNGECPGELFIKISTVFNHINLRLFPLSLD